MVFASKELIDKGWSGDKKYKVTTADGKTIMECLNAGRATITVTATYNGNIFSAVEETVTSCTCRNTCTSELLLTRQAQIFSNSTCSNDYCIGQYLFL